MILFLLLSVPLTYLIANPFFNNNNIRKRTIIMPFINGMILSIPFYLLYWSFLKTFFNNWTSSGLYFFHFLNRDGAGAIYILIALFLIFSFAIKSKSEGSRLREMTGYTAGMFFTLSIYDTLVFEEWYGTLELFTTPFLRLAIVLAMSFFLSRFFKSVDWKKYLWAGLAVILPFVTTFIPLISSLNNRATSLLIAIMFFLISAIVYIMEIQERF